MSYTIVNVTVRTSSVGAGVGVDVGSSAMVGLGAGRLVTDGVTEGHGVRVGVSKDTAA